ncbi:MAG: GGDEF domain-containing protein [Pyrinomonadaceae bacterium]
MARIKSAQRHRLTLAHRRTVERELIEVSTQLQLSNRRCAEANDELRRTGDKDLLTGVYNQRWFDERLGLELRSASRRNVPLSLLFLDLDHFSLFNEVYGRAAGDECLASVAAAIKRALKRAIDAAARVGGEEFAILLPDTNAQGAVVVATKILALVRSLNIPHERSPTANCVTASIGVEARIPMPRLTSSVVTCAADQQLHQAKKLGRNRLSIHESALGRHRSAEDKFF